MGTVHTGSGAEITRSLRHFDIPATKWEMIRREVSEIEGVSVAAVAPGGMLRVVAHCSQQQVAKIEEILQLVLTGEKEPRPTRLVAQEEVELHNVFVGAPIARTENVHPGYVNNPFHRR